MPAEQIIRLSFSFGVLAAVAVWEVIAPRPTLTDIKGRRWFANLSMVVIDTAALRTLLPVLPVLDFVIYIQHVLFHFLPILWRLHRMHHTDLDIDVTTGNRFHPVEILIPAGIKLGAVAMIGPSAVAVVAFEVALNATSQFNHGNIRMPEALDRWLRMVVVTPDMHRVHHSIIPQERTATSASISLGGAACAGPIVLSQ